MCIYATLNYILLPKGQILKCPAWMHKVQSENYAFLLCCSGGGRLQRLLPSHGQTWYLRHCRSHFHSRSPGYRKKERKKEKRKKEGGMGWGRKNGGWLVRLCIAETPGDGEGTGWRLLPSSLTSHSSPSLSGLRIPSTSCAVQRGNATT